MPQERGTGGVGGENTSCTSYAPISSGESDGDTGAFIFTKEQRDGVRALKEELKRRGQILPPFPEVSGDVRLLRFMEGYEMKPEDACNAFVAMINWRRDAGVDRIR